MRTVLWVMVCLGIPAAAVDLAWHGRDLLAWLGRRRAAGRELRSSAGRWSPRGGDRPPPAEPGGGDGG